MVKRKKLNKLSCYLTNIEIQNSAKCEDFRGLVSQIAILNNMWRFEFQRIASWSLYRMNLFELIFHLECTCNQAPKEIKNWVLARGKMKKICLRGQVSSHISWMSYWTYPFDFICIFGLSWHRNQNFFRDFLLEDVQDLYASFFILGCSYEFQFFNTQLFIRRLSGLLTLIKSHDLIV